MEPLKRFDADQIRTVNRSVAIAEELVNNFYKLSMNQWRRTRFDVKTLRDLAGDEVVHGPHAQIFRYTGYRGGELLGSSAYDFYKICIQDHSIINVLSRKEKLRLFPLLLYITTHELIHIVRFSRHLQGFDVPEKERVREEARVHERTYEILREQRIGGIDEALDYYGSWRDHPFSEKIETVQ